ncbi:MAG TPA: DUF4893 domain-containing protein [Mesorhizobium sp.]|jgi:hypothetical protein|nr:DUF4893 domain-containing protein [Mesorhizobium sp.]
MARFLLATFWLSLALLPARADGELDRIITQADRARLERHETVRAEALVEAERGGDPEAVKRLKALLAEPKLGFDGFDMMGDWQCRVTKVGGLLPIVTYDWFRCHVSDDGSGWRLEKLTGSQRTAGRFFTRDDRALVYLGSRYVRGETPKPYGSGPESDQVGLAFRTGPDEWRIELPAPAFESKLDLIEFRR